MMEPDVHNTNPTVALFRFFGVYARRSGREVATAYGFVVMCKDTYTKVQTRNEYEQAVIRVPAVFAEQRDFLLYHELAHHELSGTESGGMAGSFLFLEALCDNFAIAMLLALHGITGVFTEENRQEFLTEYSRSEPAELRRKMGGKLRRLCERGGAMAAARCQEVLVLADMLYRIPPCTRCPIPKKEGR